MKEALIVAAIALLVCLGFLIAEERDHAETKRQHAEQIAGLERAGREAVESARIEERRRYTALQEIAHETQAQLDQARADAAGAADAGDRLRKRIAQLTASCRASTSHPDTAGTGPTADATADLLSDVQRRLGGAAEQLAEFADRAHFAGLACERGYQAVSKGN